MAEKGVLPSAGFTLVELLVVLAILIITISIGVPALQQLVHSNQVRTEGSRLMRTINLTRAEAISRNSPVSVCPSAMARTGLAVCAGIYRDGWIIFSNRNKDKVVDPGVDQIIRVFDPMPPGYTLTNRAGTVPASELITYLPDGSSHRNRTLLICAPATNAVTPVSIVMNIVGRPRLARNWATCPTI